MSQTLNNFTLTTGQTLNLDTAVTTLTGVATLGAGFVEGPGTILLAAGATAVLDDPIFGGDAVFDIAGTATIDFLSAPEFGGGTQGNVGVTIEVGGAFEFNPDGQGVYYAGSSMTNLGLLSSAAFYGTATNTLLLDLASTGTIQVANGTLALAGTGASSLGGTITGPGALDLLNGSFVFDPAVLTIGTLIIDAGADATLTGNQVLGGVIAETASGTLDLGGHTLSLSGGGTLQGVVTGPGVLDVTGAGFVLGGSVVAGATLEGLIEATNGAVFDNVVNDGTVLATANYGVTLRDTITNAGGTILAGGGRVRLDNGVDITGGTLAAGPGGAFVNYYSYAALDGVTNTGSVASAGGTVALLDSITNTGTIYLGGGEGSSVLVVATPVVTLSGGGMIVLQGGGYGSITAAAPGDTLDNIDNLIYGTGRFGNGTSLAVVNAGTIESLDGSGYRSYGLTLDALGGVTNTGVIQATGTAPLYLYGGFANTGGTIAATGGTVLLEFGVDITGGTLATSAGGLITVANATAVLDGVANTGTVLAGDGGRLFLLDSITNTGTIIVAGTTAEAALVLPGGPVTLSGGGTIALLDADGHDEITTNGLATLDNVDNLITGGGYLGYYNDLVLVNAGTIAASDGTHRLVIASDEAVINTGLIEAVGSAGLSIVGTVANAVGTIAAFGSLVSVTLRGDIIGGTLATGGGGIITGAATLDGVLNAGSVVVADAGTLVLRTSLINQGLITLSNTASGASLDIATTTTLTGHGTIILREGTVADTITGTGTTTARFDNVDNLIEGAGAIGAGSLLAVTNGGTIDATGFLQPLVIDARGGLTNTGLIEVTDAAGLSLSGVIANAGGTIATAGTNAGVTLAAGGDVIGGTLNGIAGSAINITDGTLDGVRNTGTVLATGGSAVLQIRNSMINSGLVAITGSSRYATLQIGTPAVTLSGGGTIALSQNGASANIKAGASAATLVNVDNLIAGAGTIGNGSTLLLALVNAGTIDADDATNALAIGVTSFTNTGLVEATGLGGLVLSGSVLNAGGTIAAIGPNVAVTLAAGAGIIGGIVAASGGGIIAAAFATLDGITNAGSLSLAAGDTLHLRDGFNNAGRFLDSNGVLSIDTPLVTLSGGGTITVGGSALIDSGLAAATLDNVDNLIDGTGTIAIAAGLTLLNAGTIDAGDTTALTIDAIGGFTNAGLLEATGIGGLILSTSIQNTGGTIAASGAGIAVTLSAGADITGGTISATGGGTIAAVAATLDGVTNTGSLLLAIGDTLHLRNGLTNAGRLAVSGGALSIDTPVVTLSGGGTIALSGSAVIETGIAAAILDNVDNLITGAGTIAIEAGLTLLNAGIIDAGDTTALTIDAIGGFTNAGLLEATGIGGLILSDSVVNTGGTIAASGAGVAVTLSAGADIAGGTISATGGGIIAAVAATLDGVTNAGSLLLAIGDTLHLRDSLANAGRLAVSGGALSIDTPVVTLSGGGTIALSGSAVIETGIAAAILDNVDNLIIGAGTIAIETGLTLLNAGIIDAGDATALTIDAIGGFTNAGLLEATGIGGLILSDSVQNTGGTIAATGAGVAVTLSAGADITGGTLASAGGGIIAAVAATLDGVTNAGSLLLAAGDTLHLRNGLSNAGHLAVSGGGLSIDTPVVTLSGGGTIAVAGSAVIDTGIAAAILDNVDNLITGAGTIAIGAGLTLLNAGIIDAGDTTALTIDAIGGFTNAGLLEATGIGGLILSDSVQNTGGTIAATGAGVAVTLSVGADISGGTLASAGGGIIAAVAATLDGVTNAGSLLLAAGDTLHLRNGLSNAGRFAASGGVLSIDTPVVTLSGGGTIALGGTAVIDSALAAATLDNVDNLISGAGTIGAGTSLAVVNAGTIDASDTAAALVIDAITGFTNVGLLEATGIGGLVLSDTIQNTGGTIAATGAGVAVTLSAGAAITGGTLSSAGGGIIAAVAATLDGVTNAGSLLLAIGDTLHLRNSLANAGRLTVSGGALSIDTTTVTLSGGGTITLGGSAVIDTEIAAAALENVDNLITGAGTIGGGTSLALINAGTIDASDTASALTIDAIGGVTNAGLLEATGAGGLQFTSGTTIANAGGLVLAAGSQIILSDITIAGGTLATSGTGRFLAAGATLDGSRDPLALAAGATLAVATSATLSLLGSIMNAGTVLLGGSLGVLSVDSATTLGGGGLISLGGGGLIAGTAGLDDIDNTIGGSGTIGGTLSLGASAAVIGSAAGLLLDAATENAGLLESAGGTLAIGGVVRDAGGAITANGGLVSFAGADLIGGTLASLLSGTLLVAGSSTFDGSQAPVFASGSLLVDAALDLLGTFANAGIATLAGTGALLIGSAPATLAGGGTLMLGGSGAVVTGAVGTLVDRDEQILGAGSLGGGSIGLVNLADGLIAATTGTLVIDAGAAGTIANAGAIEADGAALAIASGFLSNTGTLAAFDARLMAHGALQDQGGTLSGGTWLSSSVTAASTLAIGGAAVTEDNAEIILSGISSTFLSGPSALALEQTLLTVDSTGTLALEGGRGFLSTTTLTNAGTLQLGQSSFGTTGAGTLINLGVIAGTGTLSGTVVNLGTIAATADPLTIGAVSGQGTLLVDADGGSMIVAGAVAGGTAQFGGAGATLTLQATAAFGDVIAGFGTGDVIDLADVGGVNALSYDAASHLLSLFMPQPVVTGAPPAVTPVATLQFSGSYTAADFGFRPDAAGHGTSIVVPCFLAGTRLLTTRGKIAVEDLAVGDIAVTVTGARPVVWIGQRNVACDGHPRPELVWPVRIMADAFGPGLPERDLCLSPDHAVPWRGALIPVKHLLNGATIRQERVARANYYHVELDRHDVVLADGLPAESYLDTGNRGQFAGGGTTVLHPDFAGCAPLCVAGETVAAARRHLLARVAALGFVRDAPRLWVLADGIRKAPVRVRGLLHRFLLPAGTCEVAIISSAGVPAAEDSLAGDHRLLGACIGGIAVGGRAIALDDPALFAGFMAAETGGRRWTDGAARLALPAGRDPMVLDLLVHDVMPGWVGAGLRGALVAHEPAG